MSAHIDSILAKLTLADRPRVKFDFNACREYYTALDLKVVSFSE